MGLYCPALGFQFPGLGALPFRREPHLTPPGHTRTSAHTARSFDFASVAPSCPYSLLLPLLFAPSLISPWPTHTLSHAPLSPAGEITTSTLLDRETKAEYILIVRAVDGGVGHNQKTGIATVSARPSHALQLPLCCPGCCSPAHLQAAPGHFVLRRREALWGWGERAGANSVSVLGLPPLWEGRHSHLGHGGTEGEHIYSPLPSKDQLGR